MAGIPLGAGNRSTGEVPRRRYRGFEDLVSILDEIVYCIVGVGSSTERVVKLRQSKGRSAHAGLWVWQVVSFGAELLASTFVARSLPTIGNGDGGH